MTQLLGEGKDRWPCPKRVDTPFSAPSGTPTFQHAPDLVGWARSPGPTRLVCTDSITGKPLASCCTAQSCLLGVPDWKIRLLPHPTVHRQVTSPACPSSWQNCLLAQTSSPTPLLPGLVNIEIQTCLNIKTKEKHN